MERVARVLAQRRELGVPPFVFEETARTGVLSTLEAFARATPSRSVVDPVARLPGSSSQANGASAQATGPSAQSVAPPEDIEGLAVAGESDSPALGAQASPAYEELRTLAGACTNCRLSEERTHVVFSDGHPNARLLVIGEAPGANEDRTGLPFVGPAGKLLDLLLASVGLSRETSVHICNVIKCRPPENRNPRPDEIEACTPFLRRQIELVRPEVILGVGAFAAQFLTGTEMAMGKLRGEVYSYEGTPVVVTYHPAALLRNQGWIRPTWDDLQLVRRLLDSDSARNPS